MKVYQPEMNWHNDYRLHVPSCTVMEPEPVQRFSGLLDAQGNRLMVTERTEPIGYVVFPDRP